jgi:transcriptional regulator with XRE-family HTH domain
MASVKRLREKVGTQKDVAEELGVSERYLRKKENSVTPPPNWLVYALRWLGMKRD